jgi:hypothetical protein
MASAARDASSHGRVFFAAGIVLTNDGHAILREIDVNHPAAKVLLPNMPDRFCPTALRHLTEATAPALAAKPGNAQVNMASSSKQHQSC